MATDTRTDYQWRFYTNQQGEWGWCQVERTGYIIRCSSSFFARRADCIRDAEMNGY